MASPDDLEDAGYITEVKQTDVLFGRGSGPNDHEGNIRFRQLVSERKSEYLATNHRQTKAKIAREIVNAILADNGRFLKKVEPFEARRFGIPKGIDAWIIVDDDTIMEKAKQALRQNTNKGKHGGDADRVRAVSAAVASLPARAPASRQGQSSNIRQVGPGQFQEMQSFPMGVGSGSAANSNGSVSPTPIGWGAQVEPNSIGSSGAEQSVPWNTTKRAGRRGGKRNQNQQQQILFDIDKSAVTQQQTLSTTRADSGMGDISLDDMSLNNRQRSMDIGDLMTSFSRMRTQEKIGTPEENKFHESTETMGTIEPIGAYESTNGMGMSYSSMQSSTFSIFKTPMGESTDDIGATDFSRDASRANSRLGTDDMNLSDMWGTRRGSLLDRLIAEERAEAEAEAEALAQEARPLGLMDDDLGASALSVMRGAMENSTGFGSTGFNSSNFGTTKRE